MRYLAERIELRTAIIGVLVLHLMGIIGLASPLAHVVLPLTPVNLVLTGLAMVLFAKADGRTVALALLLGTFGFLVEVIGVHTGRIFGAYTYGDVLGMKVLNVPLLIGLNWSMLIFAIGVTLQGTRWPVALKIAAGSLMMVGLDLLIEPVAVHLGFWTWEQGVIPLQNYLAWGAVSLLFFTLFHLLPVKRENPIARYVLLAQVLFFAGMNLAVQAF